MNSAALKQLIREHAAEITRLHSRIHETVKYRSSSAAQKEQWQRACAEFHAKYDALAFPGGYEGALDRIVAGDPEAMEAAVCFLEVRPYFFRSGYMFKDILRKTKRAPLSRKQSERLAVLVQKLDEWRASK